MISNMFGLGGSLSYAKRDNSGVPVGLKLSELRALFSVTVAR
jgi:hypothetical protein